MRTRSITAVPAPRFTSFLIVPLLSSLRIVSVDASGTTFRCTSSPVATGVLIVWLPAKTLICAQSVASDERLIVAPPVSTYVPAALKLIFCRSVTEPSVTVPPAPAVKLATASLSSGTTPCDQLPGVSYSPLPPFHWFTATVVPSSLKAWS
jgi:hypothetical protein